MMMTGENNRYTLADQSEYSAIQA